MELILLSLGLGLAGIDPLGALLAAAALSVGVKKRAVIGFGVMVLVGTVVLGVMLSILFGAGVMAIVDTLKQLPDMIWVAVDIAVIVLLWGWAAKRVYGKKKFEKSDRTKKWLRHSIFMVGALFVLSMLADPSYLALIAAAGHQQHIGLAALAHSLWISISQLPLFALLAAIIFNKHEPVIAKMKDVQERHGQKISWFVTGVIVVAGVIFAIDLGSFLMSGEWMF